MSTASFTKTTSTSSTSTSTVLEVSQDLTQLIQNTISTHSGSLDAPSKHDLDILVAETIRSHRGCDWPTAWKLYDMYQLCQMSTPTPSNSSITEELTENHTNVDVHGLAMRRFNLIQDVWIQSSADINPMTARRKLVFGNRKYKWQEGVIPLGFGKCKEEQQQVVDGSTDAVEDGTVLATVKEDSGEPRFFKYTQLIHSAIYGEVLEAEVLQKDAVFDRLVGTGQFVVVKKMDRESLRTRQQLVTNTFGEVVGRRHLQEDSLNELMAIRYIQSRYPRHPNFVQLYGLFDDTHSYIYKIEEHCGVEILTLLQGMSSPFSRLQIFLGTVDAHITLEEITKISMSIVDDNRVAQFITRCQEKYGVDHRNYNGMPDSFERFPENLARIVFRGIIEGVGAMHALHVAHLDLSLENILIPRDTFYRAARNLPIQAKIIDFGLCRRIPPAHEYIRMRPTGKKFYLDPLINAHAPFDPILADVWSCGVMLFVMLTGLPLCEITHTSCSYFRNICRHGVDGFITNTSWLGEGNWFSQGALDLIVRTLTFEPETFSAQGRYTIQQIKDDPWFLEDVHMGNVNDSSDDDGMEVEEENEDENIIV